MSIPSDKIRIPDTYSLRLMTNHFQQRSKRHEFASKPIVNRLLQCWCMVALIFLKVFHILTQVLNRVGGAFLFLHQDAAESILQKVARGHHLRNVNIAHPSKPFAVYAVIYINGDVVNNHCVLWKNKEMNKQ